MLVIRSGIEGREAGGAQNIFAAVVVPIQGAATDVKNFFADKFAYFTEYEALKAENEQLKNELREAEQELVRSEEYKTENERLKALLDIKEDNPAYELLSGEVIGREGGNRFYSFTIDIGELDGVEIRDAVITEDGLVGYISEVGANYSKVVAVIDSDCVVGAIVSRTRDVAIVEGDTRLQEQGLCKITSLVSDKSASAGDTVETSGLGGLFPKGILIGVVGELEADVDGTTYTAQVTPLVDFSRLRSVFVITNCEVGNQP